MQAKHRRLVTYSAAYSCHIRTYSASLMLVGSALSAVIPPASMPAPIVLPLSALRMLLQQMHHCHCIDSQQSAAVLCT